MQVAKLTSFLCLNLPQQQARTSHTRALCPATSLHSCTAHQLAPTLPLMLPAVWSTRISKLMRNMQCGGHNLVQSL